MEPKYRFDKVNNADQISSVKVEWLKSLTRPQDGMWAFFRNSATLWGIMFIDEMIGYASVDDENRLLQFYLRPQHQSKGERIFNSFIDLQKINEGIVGTNNPCFLSLALNNNTGLKVHTYLFQNNNEVSIEEKKGRLEECSKTDMKRVVNFCHYSMGAPKEWLTDYIGGLIENKEIFCLELDDQIIGTCEVRKSGSAPEYADIGMVVSPDYRRQRYGTYLLNKAKSIALEKGMTPICSCEKGNVGSTNAIHNCGFVSMYQLLSVEF